MRSFSDLELESERLSIKAVLKQILHSARESIEMEFAFISEFKEGSRIFRLIDIKEGEEEILSIDRADSCEETYCARVVDGRLPEIMHNAIDFEEAAKLQVTHDLPVGAHLSVPIYRDDGSVFGTFCCFSRKPNYQLTSKDLASLRSFSDLASELLRNSLLEDRAMMELKHRVLEIIEREAFHVVCQPIFSLESDQIMGYEALTRFDPQYAEFNTEQWFLNAAKVGLTYELECATGKKAFDQLSLIKEDQYLAINVSPETILRCSNLQAMFGENAKQVVLEITEHEQIQDYYEVSQALAPLRELGLRIAVDDAGAGYASFRHILQLQPEIIKLDRSLINGLDDNPSQFALATAIVAFASTTHAKIVAEGVETESELYTVRSLDIGLAQGYLLGRPALLSSELELN